MSNLVPFDNSASKNGKTIVILYDACDARSEIRLGSDREDEAADVTAELEAMVAVGKALARLQNPAGRQRVLNWAVQRFEAGPDEHVVVRRELTSDPTLVVGDLSDLFEAPRGALRLSGGLDDQRDDLFDLPKVDRLAASPDEEPAAARPEPRLKLLVLHFVNTVRRFALGARSPETAV